MYTIRKKCQARYQHWNRLKPSPHSDRMRAFLSIHFFHTYVGNSTWVVSPKLSNKEWNIMCSALLCEIVNVSHEWLRFLFFIKQEGKTTGPS